MSVLEASDPNPKQAGSGSSQKGPNPEHLFSTTKLLRAPYIGKNPVLAQILSKKNCWRKKLLHHRTGIPVQYRATTEAVESPIAQINSHNKLNTPRREIVKIRTEIEI
jgi:hypothetical protein